MSNESLNRPTETEGMDENQRRMFQIALERLNQDPTHALEEETLGRDPSINAVVTMALKNKLDVELNARQIENLANLMEPRLVKMALKRAKQEGKDPKDPRIIEEAKDKVGSYLEIWQAAMSNKWESFEE